MAQRAYMQRSLCSLFVSLHSPTIRPVQQFGRSVMGSFSVQVFFARSNFSLSQSTSNCYVKKKKQQIFDEITEVPISLPQTALSSPSSICNSTSLWMSGSGFCFVPTLLKSRLERKTSRREHFKIISEVQRWEKIKKGYECLRVLHLPERTSSLISIKIVSSHSCPLISIIIFNKLMRSPQKCWIKKKNRWPKKVYLPKRNDSPLLTLLFSFSLQPLSHIL